jgi:hypothetical protein
MYVIDSSAADQNDDKKNPMKVSLIIHCFLFIIIISGTCIINLIFKQYLKKEFCAIKFDRKRESSDALFIVIQYHRIDVNRENRKIH